MKKQQLFVSNYTRQEIDNLQDFMSCKEFEERRNLFFKIADLFDENEIVWALGCSSNLFFRGIVDDFNDYDIIVEKSSVDSAINLLSLLGGNILETGCNDCCKSYSYCHFRFGVCDVDLISGFRIKTFGTVFYYDFNPSEIEVLNLEYLSVPVVPAETLFVLYAMMEGWQRRRRYKRELLFKYLTENLHQPQILKRAKNSYNLPEWLNAFIDKLV